MVGIKIGSLNRRWKAAVETEFLNEKDVCELLTGSLWLTITAEALRCSQSKQICSVRLIG